MAAAPPRGDVLPGHALLWTDHTAVRTALPVFGTHPYRVEIDGPRPDVTVRYRSPPDRAGVAVRASADVVRRFGAGDGAIAVVLDCSKYLHRVLALDPERKRARVQPGERVLDIAGGALVVTGAVLAVLGVRENANARERPVSFRPAVAPGYAGAALDVKF